MSDKPLYLAMIEEAAQRYGIRCDSARIAWAPDGGKMRLGAVLDMMSKGPPHLSAEDSIPIGEFIFFPVESVLKRGDSLQRLTEKERDILLCLLRARDAIVGRDDMLRSVWGYAEGVETHTLETHIYRLRQKIERDPSRPAYIVTEGEGYRLRH